jgi:hypothetical protein
MVQRGIDASPAESVKGTSLRRKEKLGSDRLGGRLGRSASTVHRVLVRHDLNRLSHVDRQTGQLS